MQIGLDFAKYRGQPDKTRAFWETLLDRLNQQTGVEASAVSMTVPLGGAMQMTNDFQIEGQPPAKGQSMPVADFRVVSPAYFSALRIPILRGRDFTHADRPGAPEVAVINQTAAKHIWGDADPVGKRFSTDGGKSFTQIVGIVGDTKEYGLDAPTADNIYVTLADNPLLDARLVVKTAGEPLALAEQVLDQIYQLDPHQPAARIRSLEQMRSESVAGPRLTTDLLGIFAALALAIAAAGIGGVMALVVNQRKHEIGVRMAIGARPIAILGLVLREGLALALLGIALGLAGAFALTRLLRTLLFEIEPTDPLTFGGVAAVLAIAAFAACYIPARRAASVDPIVALRSE